MIRLVDDVRCVLNISSEETWGCEMCQYSVIMISAEDRTVEVTKNITTGSIATSVIVITIFNI